MNSKTSAQILICLSIAYGVSIGILGALESTATAVVAIVGALVLGGLWVVRGVLSESRDAK
jgi:predicted membrane-bound mannosyltransferase